MGTAFYEVETVQSVRVLRLCSEDGTNRLRRACVLALIDGVGQLRSEAAPLIITGNRKFFSAGADLNEIAALNGPEAYEFSEMGQALMHTVARYPAAVYAAVHGYCMGGGLDLALACTRRIAAPDAIFGHRGAALGLITGWGGTQRLPRLIGRARALQMFIAAGRLHAAKALEFGLIDAIAQDPVAEAVARIDSQANRTSLE
ncbi:MAG TPA: enoyl-CoA hydratase/isomerase family protein [Terriglobales bacterium]|nr:enoyl-CoA hydratase/isomerase family protein [Terriglobales bacterium]